MLSKIALEIFRATRKNILRRLLAFKQDSQKWYWAYNNDSWKNVIEKKIIMGDYNWIFFFNLGIKQSLNHN